MNTQLSNTIFTILSLALYFFDSQISLFYNDDQISYFLPYVSIAIALVSFNSIVSQWLVRNKLYKAISFSKITQSISLNGATILLGILGYNVGGLIFGWCFGFLTGIVIMLFPFKKTFVFSTFSTKELISVAKQYKDFPMINSLHAFTDIFFSQFLLFAIITREFGMIYLGLFFVMNKYIKAPIRLIGSAVGQVYYKEANENYNANKKVLPIMLQSLKIVSFFALPIMLIVFFFGPTIFSLYLGDEWVRAGEYAQIMALPILFNFLVSPISATPLIFNRQKTAFIISVVGYVASLLAIYIAVKLSWSFKEMLILFSVTMTIYYLYLLFWYIQLSISKK